MENCIEVLGENGIFQRAIPDFTVREAQLSMAISVEDTLKFQGKLVIESGTGTGKTFAYLVPILLSGKKTIISTGTKHLQDQIFNRDMPLVKSTLGVDVNAMLLKGRSNYLCKYRLKQHNNQGGRIGQESTINYAIINEWASRTKQGDIAEIIDIAEDNEIWGQVTSTIDNCLGGKCPSYSDCFVYKAREKALKADIIIINHHLFFSDLCLKSKGFGELFPDQEAIIFDEAHRLPEIAGAFFGFSVSSYQLQHLLKDMQLANKEENNAIDLTVIALVEKQVKQFHQILHKSNSPVAALDTYATAVFEKHFKHLLECIGQLQQTLGELTSAGEATQSCIVRCQLLQDQLYQWWDNSSSDMVSWLEVDANKFRLTCTPLHVGKYLSHMFADKNVAWVFTSATLSVKQDFSSFVQEIGLQDVDTVYCPSPYDFACNCMLYLPNDLPDPRNQSFLQSLSEKILQITTLSSGRTFCLFTSHAAMNRVYENIESVIEWPLLVQGKSSKQKLIESFIEHKNAVLLGTYSFWEGVDIKGDILSCVIVDKLPFASPSDPVLKKRLEVCEQNGGNPFMDIQLSKAVITLKQGVGRLIRSEDDKGVVVICDNRIKNKLYGKLFLESLPEMPVTSDLNDIARFFNLQ